MKSKIFLFFAIVFSFSFSFTLVASAEERKLSDGMRIASLADIGKPLDNVEIADLWSKFDQIQQPTHRGRVATNAFPDLDQAQAFVEVVVVGNHVTANFQTIEPLPDGSVIAFRMKLPGGTINMGGYYTSGNVDYFLSAEFWNGNVPNLWPGGITEFQAIMLRAGEANLYFVSGFASIHNCCSTMGPLKRADLTLDGTAVEITGNFNGPVIVTINGWQVPTTFSFDPKTGENVGKVSLANYSDGQQVLTVCAGGGCSSRLIYINRGGGATVTQPRP